MLMVTQQKFGAGAMDPAVDGKLILFTHPPLPGFAYLDVSYMYHRTA